MTHYLEEQTQTHCHSNLFSETFGVFSAQNKICCSGLDGTATGKN